MAEEITPQEMVKKQQLAIAASMKIQQEILNILDKIEEWHVREWLYICAVDGMSAEKIMELAETKASVRQIRKARMEYLRNRCVQTDMLQIKIETLHKEVQEVCQESRQTRSTIENGLEDALKKQALAQTETIRAKDDMIEMLKNQIMQLQEQNKHIQTSMISVPDSGTREEPLQEIKHNIEPLESTLPESKKKTKPGQIFSLMRRGSETRKFIERYIQNDKMSMEQTDFLLECLEEGMSLKEIESFAAPGLSVDVMRRLKTLSQSN
jgi:hypothetical protein